MATNRNARSALNYIDNLVTVVISPDVTPQRQNLSEDNFRLAELLTFLEGFNKAISDIRQHIQLNKVLPYPQNPNVESVTDLFFEKPITDKTRAVLKDWAKELRTKYNLPKSWDVPFQITALTNVLPAPPSDSIGIHIPRDFIPNEQAVLGGLSNGSVVEGRILKYPAIYFTRQFSIDELKHWINDNKDLIRAMQNRLPEKKILKREPKTLFWGHVAWIYRQGGINSWTLMSDRLQAALDTKYEKGSYPSEDFPGDFAPSPGELRKYYIRYIKSLQEIE